MKRGAGKRRNNQDKPRQGKNSGKNPGRTFRKRESGGSKFGKKKHEGSAKGNRSFDGGKSRDKFKGKFDKGRKYSGKPKDKGRGSEWIRLNRYIANAGVCSRREADEYIRDGKVKVNGTVVTEMGTKVRPADKVEFKGRLLQREEKVYLMLNKPKDFISTTDDPEDRKTVLHLVKDATDKRIYPVGRLDRNTTGVLLLTNDGELTRKLTHPGQEIPKVYDVRLDKPIDKGQMEELTEGLQLNDGFVAADAVSYVDPSDKTRVGLELHSGRNRVVRRMFEHLGFRVKQLDRTAFAGITKKDVKRGYWRYLSKKEVNILYMLPLPK